MKRYSTVFNAGAFQVTARTSPVAGSVTENGALPPVAFIPPWHPEQLNPPSAVGSNNLPPHPASWLAAASRAPAWRLGSNTQYSGNPMTMTMSSSTPMNWTNSRRRPSSSSSS